MNEKQLAQNIPEDKYRHVIDSLQVGVVVYAADLSVLLNNPEANRILGLTDEQLRGKQQIDAGWYFIDADKNRLEEAGYPVNKVISSGKPLENFVLGIIRPDRNYITWVSVKAAPVPAENIKTETIIMSLMDITGQKGVEDELLHYQDKITVLAETTAKFNSAGDIDSIIDILGENAVKLGFGYSAIYERKGDFLELKKLTGINEKIFSRIPVIQDNLAAYSRVSLTSENNILSKTYNRQKSQTTDSVKDFIADTKAESMFALIYKALPLSSFNNFTVFPIYRHGVITFSNPRNNMNDGDITWIKSLINQASIAIQREYVKKEKEEVNERLIQSQKMEAIGHLAGGVAHDFNNLLTAIMGYSQFLADSFSAEDPRRSDIEEIIKASRNAASLTTQLLAFSRKQVMQSSVMDINLVIADMKKMLMRLIGENISLTTFTEPDIENVKVDKSQMEQVIMNLVINARDAMPAGGKITIRTENISIDNEQCQLILQSKPGSYVRISIEDTGMGMEKETLDHVFEPFFSTKGDKGTGLGLSVVYGIIKQHGGFINVYSEKGEGSVFKIYLPAVLGPAEAAELNTKARDNTKHSDKNEKILVVEDEEAIRKFVIKALSRNNYRTHEAASAREALNIFKNEKMNFNLVLTDMILPDSTGLQLAEKLLELKPGLNILLSSGYTDNKTGIPDSAAGKFTFLQKPYSVEDLLDTIRAIFTA